MSYRVSMSELMAAGESVQNEKLGRLVRAATSPSAGTKRMLANRVHQFETEAGMTSKVMVEKLKAGEIEETPMIARWLFWLETRDCHVTG